MEGGEVMKRFLMAVTLTLPLLSYAGTNHPALDTLLEALTDKGVFTPEEAMKIAEQLRKDMEERDKEIKSMIKKAIEEKSK